ncbi:TonB-dependent receptor-like protein [Novosphingobium kunmingense]|uniref:TonB-dependent receptor-like protein n=1 Tax=Novosphingobium kunmingense TaxID=1211806 RepID=A0A2N0H4V5_9SPHN|nr:TonB-dependent receptor [Novosphingobium kunmingense]PKB13953.1 TonB-dependent receptor-like protein [Novosphingobium kunmingense]
MKTSSLFALKASSAPFVLGLALISSAAHAQDATTDTAAEDATDESQIVVTGSLIRNPNLVQANPVNVTTADQIELKQSNLAEEVLRELPGVVASVGSAVNNGNGGASYVDLRGLGSNRNIVLLDGQRIAPADLAGRVDLNNIPLALISRVDALTGAAVTTYGADAITGVVNFITRKDFSGVDLSVGEQITERGDGNYLRADLTVGANFDDGRGNAVLSIGYQESDPVYQGDRDFSVTQISSYTGGPAGSGTTVPSRFTGTRPFAAGALNITPRYSVVGTTANGTPILAVNTAGANNNGTSQLNPATGAAVGTFATFNFNPYNVFQTPFKRYNMFAQANYEVSDAVEVYTRGLFSRNTVSTIIAPSGSFASPVTINLNNPFLPATLRNQFCAFNVAPSVTGVDSTGAALAGQTTYTPRFTPAECAAAATATGPSDPNYRTVTTNLGRRAVEVGPRISEYGTTIFDLRVGARGAITETVNWDVGAAYGESQNIERIKGYTLQSRFRQGLLVNGTAANPVCNDTSNGCVPVNVFGPAGSISPAAVEFLSDESTSTVVTTLAQARGIVSGDLGFTSPGATQPVGFAVGAEYRKYTAMQAADSLAKTPGELGGAGGADPDINGGFDVYEGYAELVVPLLEDKPLFHSLTVEGGVRYSSYTNTVGVKQDTWTYKVGGSWEPVSSLKLRGNYSRAVRAPNIGEMFTPNNTVLTNLGIDPCAGAAPVSNANLRAICIAQGATAAQIGTIDNPTAGQANITTSGNPFLAPETATTWTVGGVFQPDFVPGLSMTLDYYNIKVKDVIGAPLPGDLVSACFGSITAASATSPACTAIRRDPLTGQLDGDPSTTGGLFAPLSNLGKLFTDGLDLIVNYNRDIGFAKLGLSFVGNHTIHSRYQATPSSLDRECVGYYSVNCSFTGSIQPKWQFSQRTTLSFKAVDVSLLWRWIDKVEFEPQQILDDEAAFGSSVMPEFRSIPAASYFDLTTRFNVADNFTFTVAVQNLLDKQPKVVGNTIGSTSYNSGNVYPSTYDALGRRYAVSAKLKF